MFTCQEGNPRWTLASCEMGRAVQLMYYYADGSRQSHVLPHRGW